MNILDLYQGEVPKSHKIKQILDSIDFMENFKIRSKYIEEYSFSLYSLEELKILSKLFGNNRVYEFGCGSGYLTSQMKQLGCNYYGIDNYQTRYRGGYTFDNGNSDVIKENAIKFFTQRAKSSKFIVMSWPDYTSPFAYRLARLMRKGSILVYKGEDYGGCTADDKFFNYIETHFKQDQKLSDKLNKYSNQFLGAHDYWYVWTKIKGRR